MKWPRRFFRATAAAALCLAAGDQWIRTAALPPLDAPLSATVTDRDGTPLRVFLAADGRWRLPTAAARVDPRYAEMLIAYEDKRFHSHAGVDPIALARAAVTSLWAGRIVSGGSTLTMQVARLLDDGTTGQWRGKIRQIRLALALERRLSKAEILEIYLTRAPMGGNLEGVRAASFSYFGKDARRLTPAEMALLVALPQAPELRRPDRFGAAARAGRDRVLTRARVEGVLNLDDVHIARRAAIPDRRRPFPASAWHLAERARAGAAQAPVHRTDLDATAQRAVERVLGEAAPRLPPRTSAAVVVLDHRTARMRASVGAVLPGRPARGGFLDMAATPRSPGSALKPFIYALAFEDGILHPETLVEDRPTDFRGYAPRNFDSGFQGTLSVRAALRQSLNVPAVAALDAVGPARLRTFLSQTGVTLTTPGGGDPGLALALGGAGVTLTDLTRAYAMLARQGTRADRRLLSRRAAWYVADILKDAPAPQAALAGRIAFKTGTSYGYRDAWALGFDGRHTVGVWIGRPDGASVPGLIGHARAAPLLFQVFAALGADRAPLPPPPRDALIVAHGQLPPPLRHLPGPGGADGAAADAPRIVYPPDGARIDLGRGQEGARQPLVLRLERGRRPYTWMVNGKVLATGAGSATHLWPDPDPGYSQVTVIDAMGRAATAHVFLD